MSSVLNTSTSALLAFQRALTTVSHNVANINTEGYSRQKTDFATATPNKNGNGFLGTGTTISSVRRVADQLAITRLIDSNSEVSRLSTLSGLADRVDGLMSDSATNLEGGWSKFFNAVSGLSSDASSVGQRQSTLDEAKSLASRFNVLNTQLSNLDDDVNNKMVSAASEINRLSTEIASINRQIGSNPSKASPDLLDRRDAMANQLISYTGGSITLQDGGLMNITTAGGTALVVGATASKVTTINDSLQPSRLQLSLTSGNITVDLSTTGLGGTVGGLMDFRNQVLDPTQAELGRIALGLTQAFNAQQAAGVDAYGQPGSDLFTIGQPQAVSSENNNGTASLTISATDLAKLSGQNIRLYFNAGQWQATDARSGEPVSISGAGSSGDPFVIQGMEIVVDGSPTNGDQFLLRPTAGLAGTLSVAITDPGRLAAASAVQANALLSNTGAGKLGALQVTDAANADLSAPVDIVFTSATQYTLNGAGPHAYTAGAAIEVNGWRLVLDGKPAEGDTFTVRKTPANSSNNANASLLAAVEDLKLFGTGTQSLTDVMAGMTTRVGTAARSAEYSLESASSIQQLASDNRESISGVNLDEEAAEMLRLQQAYQAASQMVSTADTMFQTILGVVSR